MVKTLIVETDLAVITVQEEAGFDVDGSYRAQLQLALACHIAGVEELPPTLAETDALINRKGWDAVIKYTRMVRQTRCIQWKGDALLSLPSEYAAYPLHCAAFDAMRDMPSDFLKTWLDGIEQVSKTVRDLQTEGKTSGE